MTPPISLRVERTYLIKPLFKTDDPVNLLHISSQVIPGLYGLRKQHCLRPGLIIPLILG